MEHVTRHNAHPAWLTRALLFAATAATAGAQSFNIDFGALGTQPTPAYGAGAAQPGIWNEIPTAASQNLDNIAGAATAVNITVASAQNFSFDNAGTTGDDEALMDSFIDLPTTVTVTGLAPGNYTVFTYAWAPDDPSYVTNVVVTGSPEPLQPCGGPWPGVQQLGVTYTRHTLAVAAGGTLEVVFTLGSGFVSCNGLQIVAGSATIGTNYCTAVPNSTGSSATISASGSAVAANNNLTLEADLLPNSSFGYFLTSTTQGFVANPGGSSGNLCLGGSIGRYVGPGQIKNSGTLGAISLALNLTQTPQPSGFVTIAAGQTWSFQAWFRDSAGGVATSNFTNGLTINFL